MQDNLIDRLYTAKEAYEADPDSGLNVRQYEIVEEFWRKLASAQTLSPKQVTMVEEILDERGF